MAPRRSLVGGFTGLHAGCPLVSGEPGAVGTDAASALLWLLRSLDQTGVDHRAPLAHGLMATGSVDDVVAAAAGDVAVGEVMAGPWLAWLVASVAGFAAPVPDPP